MLVANVMGHWLSLMCVQYDDRQEIATAASLQQGPYWLVCAVALTREQLNVRGLSPAATGECAACRCAAHLGYLPGSWLSLSVSNAALKHTCIQHTGEGGGCEVAQVEVPMMFSDLYD